MVIKINQNFHPRSIELVRGMNDGRVKPELDSLPLGTLCMYYLIALQQGFTKISKSMELEFEIRHKQEFIVPQVLFSQLNPSMLGLPFAKRVAEATAANCGDLVAACYDYFPPSFGFMIGYLEAISFDKKDLILIFEKLIKAHCTVAAVMPAFLELAQSPQIVDRISELQKIIQSAKPVVAEDFEPIEEDIEKHDELNPKLFESGKLKKEVREQAQAVADELLKMLEEAEVKLVLKDLILTGSNASYNYTKDSDIDLHLVADTSDLEDPDNLYPALYQAYKSAFNKKYNIEFYGIPVEVYIECQDTPLVSNGIYSVMNDEWVKEPVQVDIPDVDEDAFQKAFEPWEARYIELIQNIDSGAITDEVEIDKFVDDLYTTRASGLKDGEYSEGNLIFKEIRNKGYLDNLKDLRAKVISDKLTLEELNEGLSSKDLEYYRTEIQRLTFEQPIIQPNGLFELYNIKERNVQNILNVLSRQDFIDFVQASASKYDFNTFARSGIPSQLYRIYGQLK